MDHPLTRAPHHHPMHRRQWARLALAGATALALSACGGGSGGDDGGSSNNLREAFDKLEPGMLKEDVIALVGRAPDHDSADKYGGSLGWRAGSEWLDVELSIQQGETIPIITSARWDSGTTSETRLYV
ncbi:hypothetical protein H010_03922 [Hydrogenophaga taeniospiralis CCUG 15921]|uniref:Lipoprotein n=1 Tax=Hydrogenophaga taeniospiralis CCUG 15921 TaxID=1281780 RepID=A0A9X4NU20_9BURK|nr:hypothetical protein [Hydrogenophaga taeniospiralis]MDG5974385.1 hypothetical protein [Hydrogenophaga taeniospiralis CCUG 15921]